MSSRATGPFKHTPAGARRGTWNGNYMAEMAAGLETKVSLSLVRAWRLGPFDPTNGRSLELLTVQQGSHCMSIIGWLVLGLIAGFIGSKIVNKTGEGVILDIVLGIVGAVVGGFLFAQFGAEGVTGFNIYSMFVAVIGAIVVLLIYHAVMGRRRI